MLIQKLYIKIIQSYTLWQFYIISCQCIPTYLELLLFNWTKNSDESVDIIKAYFRNNK